MTLNPEKLDQTPDVKFNMDSIQTHAWTTELVLQLQQFFNTGHEQQ